MMIETIISGNNKKGMVALSTVITKNLCGGPTKTLSQEEIFNRRKKALLDILKRNKIQFPTDEMAEEDIQKAIRLCKKQMKDVTFDSPTNKIIDKDVLSVIEKSRRPKIYTSPKNSTSDKKNEMKQLKKEIESRIALSDFELFYNISYKALRDRMEKSVEFVKFSTALDQCKVSVTSREDTLFHDEGTGRYFDYDNNDVTDLVKKRRALAALEQTKNKSK